MEATSEPLENLPGSALSEPKATPPATPTKPAHGTRVIEPKKGWKVIDWREIIEYRDLLYFLVLRDVTVLYKQTVLGFSWAIINPFFQMVVLTVVFGKMVKIDVGPGPHSIVYYAALLPWTYFSAAMVTSTNSLITGTGIFTKVYFPRLFIPLVPCFSKLVDFGIAMVVMVGMMLWHGVAPSLALLWVPVLIVLMILTASGVGMWLSAMALQYRDIRHAISFVIQILMYGTPVIWTISKTVPDKYLIWYSLYPMAGVIEGFRYAFLGQYTVAGPDGTMVSAYPMPLLSLGIGAVSALVLFISGAFYYRRMERVFADVA